jgi:hypothetical protein
MIVLPALADRTNLQPAWNLFTPQQDIEMGRLLAEDAERSLQLVDDSNSNAYIDALGRQLAVYAPGTRYPYQFKIAYDDSVNAWALPGGYIYVTTSLIEHAQNEPQLAGYLAHAIAHSVLRHGTAEVSRAYSGRSTGSARRVNVNDVMTRLNIRFEPDSIPLKYTREEERQAGLLATQILWDAGFDANQMTQTLRTLANNRSTRSADFLTSHPYLSNYGAIVRTEIRNLGGQPRNPRGDSPDFHSVQDRLAASNTNWPSISERDRDWVNGPESPSSRMIWYRGNGIEFRHPDNWNVSDQGNSLSVAPEGGFVSGSMAYGMTIAMFDPQDTRFLSRSFSAPNSQSTATTLSSATDALVDHLRESNPNMRVVGNTQRRRVDGDQALVVELTNDSPIGGTERIWLVTVQRPGGLLRYFAGVAPQRDFNRYQGVFEQLVNSVRLLD